MLVRHARAMFDTLERGKEAEQAPAKAGTEAGPEALDLLPHPIGARMVLLTGPLLVLPARAQAIPAVVTALLPRLATAMLSPQIDRLNPQREKTESLPPLYMQHAKAPEVLWFAGLLVAKGPPATLESEHPTFLLDVPKNESARDPLLLI